MELTGGGGKVEVAIVRFYERCKRIEIVEKVKGRGRSRRSREHKLMIHAWVKVGWPPKTV